VRSRWVYRPYIAKHLREHFKVDLYGYLKPILFGKQSYAWSKILAAHAASLKQIEFTAEPDRLTLAWLADRYEESQVRDRLQPATRKKNKTLRQILQQQLTINGEQGTLGKSYPEN